MKIAIVIGHRKGSKGAVGNVGIAEWDFYVDFMEELLNTHQMKKSNNEFKVFHRKNSGSGYTERMKDLHHRIDKWGAKVSVSLHFNGASNPSVNGHEVLYHSKGGKKLAREMNDAFTKHLPNKDRGIKHREKHERGGGFLARGKSKCILVEPFFSSHQSQYVGDIWYRDNLKKAFIDFLA